MSNSEQIFQAMETTLDDLVRIAADLKELSRGTVSSGQLEALQARQDELVVQLCNLDNGLSSGKGNPKANSSPIWARIQDKINAFSELNESFIQNIKVRKGLIQFEVQQVKKTRQALSKMREGYTISLPSTSQTGSHKPKVDTVS